MHHVKEMCYSDGKLPAVAPLANPYVPFQQENPPMYEPRKALIRGTLFTGLDLPFGGKENTRLKAVTPMSELQSISFAIQELALYLDTHRDDKEALTIYRKFQEIYHDAKCNYEKKYGPLTHNSISTSGYKWLNDPWPWEYAKNCEV